MCEINCQETEQKSDVKQKIQKNEMRNTKDANMKGCTRH